MEEQLNAVSKSCGGGIQISGSVGANTAGTADASFEIESNLVDLFARRIYPARIRVKQGVIVAIDAVQRAPQTFAMPGFIDAHVHVESSMLVPREFARAAVLHGTVATLSDPHEIGNVLGLEGVEYMLENAADVPFKFYFGAPSCVPATAFETAGAALDSVDVTQLLNDPRIGYLSEMMNFPGVLSGDEEILARIRAAQQRGKPIDGHAPGMRGPDVARYFGAGISTDHECFAKEEALEKLRVGVKILIREGSAARNFDALYSLLDEYPDDCMFCSDDKHPDELLQGHINDLVLRAVDRGIERFHALRAACVNPVLHYGLDVGLLRVGDPADFIEVDSLERLRVLRVFVAGQLVADHGRRCIPSRPPRPVNRFATGPRDVAEFACRPPSGAVLMNVIEALDGQLVTRRLQIQPTIVDGQAVSDPARDLLKITVVNRYQAAAPAVAFVKNFGLSRGAIASTVAHDSHNVIAVGATDEELCRAVNEVIQLRGGLSVVSGDEVEVQPLPIAGLMSDQSCNRVGSAYAALDKAVKQLGSTLRAPFMTLSFMALLVIPELKLSDRGLFDGHRFELIELFD